MSGSTTVVISLLPCVPSRAPDQLEDLTTKNGSLSQGGERVADAFERIATGDGHHHRSLCSEPQRVLQIRKCCGHCRHQRRLRQDELDGVDGERLVRV